MIGHRGKQKTSKLRAALLMGAPVYAMAALMSAQPAHAQAVDQIETITVTAEKRSESLQNVPLSIVAVSGDQLQASGVNNATQLQKIVPDLQISQVPQSAGVIFRIRGFGSGANAAIDSDVAAYLDTAYIPRPGAIISSFLDVKSVEVLRGPQGTLFGRNAAMGAISITTNAPSFDGKSLEASVEGGNHDLMSAEAVANLPVSDDFALRLAVSETHHGGFYKNRFDGKNYGATDTPVGRLSAKWQVTPDLSWTLRLDGALTNGDGLLAMVVDTGSASAAQLAHMNAVIGILGGTPPTLANPPSFTLNQRLDHPYLHDAQYGLTSDVSWSVRPDITLRLVDTYRNWSNRQGDGDVVWTTLDLLNRHETFASKAQSHELQIISPKGAFLGHRLGFTAGLYYFQESYSLNEVLDLGSRFCAAVYGAAHPALVAPCMSFPQTAATAAPFHQDADSFAGYFQLNYAILPDLELNVGARQTWDHKTGSFVQTIYNPFVGAGVLRAPENDPSLKFDDSRPSWLANLSWHVNDDVMAFLTYSTGYKSGGFNSAPGAVPPPTRTFGSEMVTDYELGVKSMWWNRRILLNANIFNTVLNNFQDRSYNGLSFVIRNAGTVRSRGMEVEGQVHAIPHVDFNFGADYLDSIYRSDPGAPGLDGCTGLPGCPVVQNLSGRQLPFAPKWQGNLGVNLSSNPFLGGYTAILALNETLSSGYLSENNDSQQSHVAGYGVLDARLSLFTPDSNWELDLFAQNLLDRHYFTLKIPTTLGSAFGVNNPATGATLYRGTLGDPRVFGVRLSAKF